MDKLGFSDGIDHGGKGDAVRKGRNGIDEPYTVMLRERGLLDINLFDHPDAPLERSAYPTPLPRDAYTDDFCGQNALKLLNRAPEGKPWFLWVNFPGPHDPFDPPAEVLQRYNGVTFPSPVAPSTDIPSFRNPATDRRHYAASCSNIDDWVGKLVEEVERRGERDNTIIIFASDHGEMLGDHGRWRKSIWYEASIRVPLIMAGPEIAKGHSSELIELIDLSATLLNLANEPVPEAWDARSFDKLLEEPDARHRDFAVSALDDWRCLTTNEWKIVEKMDGSLLLYDLCNDPAELRNVAPSHLERLAELYQLLAKENPWHPERNHR